MAKRPRLNCTTSRYLEASLVLDAGEFVTLVAARFGHRDTSTTLKAYGHLMPGAYTRAAPIVRSALAKQEDKAPEERERC